VASAEPAGPVQVVEDDLVDRRHPVAVAVAEPDQFFDFVARGLCSLVIGGVAGHPHHGPGRMAVSLRLEGADVQRAGRDDGDADLFLDLPDEGLYVGLAGLALAAGKVVDVLAAGPGAEDPAVLQPDPRDLVDGRNR